MTMATTHVSEKASRDVVEAAREAEWKLPSFGKQLFMGDFRLDLIHPQSRLGPEAIEKGERFIEELRALLTEEADPLEIEREAKIPDRVLDGLKRIGALGMKVPEEYGGLGLSQVYYSKALAIAGVWHSALCTLLSAHQSIGVAQPLLMFGTEEQRRKWLPLVAKDHISAFLLTEPGVGSDPARMASIATPVQPEHAAAPVDDDLVATPVEGGYTINGRKLWATNGTIADIVVVMAKVPKSEGHRGGITAFVLPYTTKGITVEHRNSFMGLRGIENSVTRPRERVRPRGEPHRSRRRRAQDRAQHPEHGAAVADGDGGRGVEVGDQSGPRVVAGARAVGSPHRQARRGGAEAGVHRRQRVRPRGDAGCLSPPGRRQAQRHPHRGRAVQGVRLGALVAGDRRADAGSRRSRLRDGGVAEGAWREARAGRAVPAGHARQPHLRRLERDHAPADRARGGRRPPPGRRRSADAGAARTRPRRR